MTRSDGSHGCDGVCSYFRRLTGAAETSPIWAAPYDFDRDCLGEDQEIGRFPGRSPRIAEDSSTWIRNNTTGELWFLLTTTDLAHLDEEWELAECDARPCVADLGPGRWSSCEIDPDAGSGLGVADAE